MAFAPTNSAEAMRLEITFIFVLSAREAEASTPAYGEEDLLEEIPAKFFKKICFN
jgi:hypothetical protein